MASGRFAQKVLQMAGLKQAVAAAAAGRPAELAAEYHALRRAMSSAAQEVEHEEGGRHWRHWRHGRHGGRWGLCRGGRAAPWSALNALEGVFPGRNLQQVIDRMDRLLFDDAFFSRHHILLRPAASAWRSPWDFAETADAFRLRLDLPGFARDDVRVVVEDGELVITAEQTAEQGAAEQGAAEKSAAEQSAARQRYSTRITLPDDTDAAAITAELKNGVLSVTVPKMVEVEPKKNVIDVHVH